MPDILPNPLRSIHQQAEAEFQPYGEVEVVATFGQPPAEYAAIHKGCALFDLPQRGVLEVGGEDRLAFLNNLLTNRTWDKEKKSGLAAGEGVYAFFLNNKGRIIADMNVLELGDRTWLEMDGRLVESVRLALDRYLFAERVTMASKVGVLHEMALHGPGAESVLHELAGETVLPDATLGSGAIRLFDVDATIWRDDVCGVPGYFLVFPIEAARSIWMGLLERFGQSEETGKRRLRTAGWAVFNAARIEAGRPIFGIDFDDSILPAETGQLGRAVSFTKGCYIGQEIVARMHARNQFARQLVGFRMESDALPIAGTKIFDPDGNEIGGVTSSTLSPLLSNTAIGLGYVKKQFVAAGTELHIPAEGAIRKGKVSALPLVK